MSGKGVRTETICPFCMRNTDSTVSDSRPCKYKGTDQIVVRRRRKCQSCGAKYSTLEIPEWFVSSVQQEMDALDNLQEVLHTMRDDLKTELERERMMSTGAVTT